MAKRQKNAPPSFLEEDHYAGDDSVMPGFAFWTIALIVFVAITVAAVVLGTSTIEEDLESRANAALDRHGYINVTAEASGTDLTLAGSFTAEQSSERAFTIAQRIGGVAEVSGQLYRVSEDTPEDIVVIGDALEVNWDATTVKVTGEISSVERHAFIAESLAPAFDSVDVDGLIVTEGIEDEGGWIGTALSLVLSLQDPIEVGRLILVPAHKLVVVSGFVDDKILRNKLNKQIVEASADIGFDSNPAVRVPDVERTALPPTEEEVVALQIDLDALLKDKVVEFEVKSDVITDAGAALLNEILEILRLEPEIRIEIAGHADSQGRETTNMILSQARAQSVFLYLIARGEVPERYTVVGYGETQPIADNDTEEGRARNRRIEFRASLGEDA